MDDAVHVYSLFSIRMFLFRQPFLMVADPDMIKEILIKEFPKFHNRKVIRLHCTVKLIYCCLYMTYYLK